MRLFFMSLFFISLLAMGGAYYWRTYHPESFAVDIAATRTMTSSMSARSKSGETASMPSEKAPSERQDWAMMISIGSSIVSAIGAIAQVWLTHRSVSRA